MPGTLKSILVDYGSSLFERFVSPFLTDFRFVVSIILVVAVAPYVPSLLSLSDDAVHVLVMVIVGGGALVCIYGARQRIVEDRPWLGTIQNTISAAFVLLVVVLLTAIFHEYVDYSHEFLLDNPMIAISFVLSVIVLKVFRRVALSSTTSDGAGEPYVAAYDMPRIRKTDDIHRTAIHEAGHLLMFGCAEVIKSTLSVKVYTQLTSSDHFRGFVSDECGSPHEPTERYIRWNMMMLVAGVIAERVVFSDVGNGGTLDYRRWTYLASHLLNCGLGEAYFEKPETYAEHEHNRRALNALKERCEGDVTIILRKNQELLVRLADRIVHDGQLDHSTILGYLHQVELPENYQERFIGLAV
jgi:hypothetical protein|tara:strand:+ start:1977 stop:3044 length:1068 start_codon:yes stop_codon:yes gene_type:complete